MLTRRALPSVLAATSLLLGSCSSSTEASATDPCAAGRDALAAGASAYASAFAAARACDPSAGAAPCLGSTVTERCGCALPANADAAKRAALAMALAELEAAEKAQQSACDAGAGFACSDGCAGAPGPSAALACVATGDAGVGVCGYP